MRVFFIGFGQAGGKIVDMFIEQDKKLGTNSFRGTATAGEGFTLSTDNSGTGTTFAQYSISGVSSPTNFQATTKSAGSWAEDAIALMPS